MKEEFFFVVDALSHNLNVCRSMAEVAGILENSAKFDQEKTLRPRIFRFPVTEEILLENIEITVKAKDEG